MMRVSGLPQRGNNKCDRLRELTIYIHTSIYIYEHMRSGFYRGNNKEMANSAHSMDNTAQKLAGKVIIITGGASGIGEETARLFANHGARMVVIADIQDELGNQVAASIGSDRYNQTNSCIF